MTDAGYVAGGYGVTAVAIGAYIGHMWVRSRALRHAAGARPATPTPPDSAHEAR